MDALANFAIGALQDDLAADATGCSLADYAQFRMPQPPFTATIWPAGQLARFDNAEIVRVTSISGNWLTLQRGQEATNPRAFVSGDQLAQTITAKTLTDLAAASAGPASAGPAYRGAWDAQAVYVTDDLVLHDGHLYVCTAGPGAQATFVGSSAANSSGKAAFALPLPAGAQAGDLALIAVTTFSGDFTAQLPTDATLLLQQGGVVANCVLGVGELTLTDTHLAAGALTVPAQYSMDAAATSHVFRDASTVGAPAGTSTLTTTPVTGGPGASLAYAAGVSIDAGITQGSLQGVAIGHTSTNQSGLHIAAGYEPAGPGPSTARTFTPPSNTDYEATVAVVLDGASSGVTVGPAGDGVFPTSSFTALT